ncbi:tetratricopeptide repeat protein [Pedobacter panaciterrae]|uniref:Tetratricopeptide repeat protein n=1 Tax=Pedobacter panaciterrae TaxID=363849 RepID=A0ABU8NTD8_9SPHI
MKRFCFSLILFLVINIGAIRSQSINPDSTEQVFTELIKLKKQLVLQAKTATDAVPVISRMLELGMWETADSLIKYSSHNSIDYQLLKCNYLILNNKYKEAEIIMFQVLKQERKNEKALLIKGFLEIQAWRLLKAENTAKQVLQSNPDSEDAALLLGRVKLLKKEYETALQIAKEIQQRNPKSAKAYLLEADVYFWDQHPEKAEQPLIKSLELDPFNADARFSYGYAIWRRVDATQLNAMAAQWELALAINPLHYQTHWHWGNGHTNLTYADYAEANDEEVRKALLRADQRIKSNDVQGAIEITRAVENQYSNSVLPLMHRASIYYSAFDLDRGMRLDSAEHIFKSILLRKKHYGPAHNGLSAVIKSKRIPYLDAFDAITKALDNTKIRDMKNFTKVFSDVSYYPGETAKAMVWNQLYSSVVYFPFLSKQGNTFKIPPLHQDLAVTMDAPAFRYMTTFDNRQWMDIRGVGSGAAGIEYVERGAFMERNVVLHEYVHLFHGAVLTDAENRKIRALYYDAMKQKRTLDYYSQNNESEYFAQTYPAYFEPVKVHPLDFKSMNTSADLKSKDPDMYSFLDKLVSKEKAYLAGDKKAMASNWAEVYVNLASRAGNSKLAVAYLDTALTYDAKYLPAFLSIAHLKIYNKDFSGAEQWLVKAKSIDIVYAPIYAMYADLVAAKYAARQINQEESVKQQAGYLQQSITLEDDYQELAKDNLLLREMYRKNAKLKEAIEAADLYIKTGATVSTYLRDRIDDAIAFSAFLRATLGDTQQVAVLKKLVEQKPQNFELRNMYADALAENKQYKPAIATLKEAQRILTASGNGRPDYNLRIAEFYNELKYKDSTDFYLQPFLSGKLYVKGPDQLRYIRLLVQKGYKIKASELLKKANRSGDNIYASDYLYTSAKLLQANRRKTESMALYEKAIQLNPYHFAAYQELIDYAKAKKQVKRISELQLKMKKNNLR